MDELGYRDVTVYRGGILDWQRSGFPLETPVAYPKVPVPLIGSADLAGSPPPGATLVDIRPRSHFDRGHIPDSLNLDLEDLHRNLDRLPGDRELILIDHKGKLTLTTGRFLSMHGFQRVRRLDGGFNAWVKGGLPIAKGAVDASRPGTGGDR